MNKTTQRLLAGSTAFALLALIGCTNSVWTEDRTGYRAGDAQARNLALQAGDPWPRNADNTHIHGDGQRAVNAVDTYRAPPAENTIQDVSRSVSGE